MNNDLFMNMTGLHSIDLNNNKLRSLPAGLFQNQHKLVSVFLANNILAKIPARLFQNLPSLETVDLSNNLLSDIPARLFQSLPSLETVDLSNNSLTIINSSAFVNLPALEKINIAANQLNYMADDAISLSLDLLEYIDLSKNQLTTIPTSILCLSNLQSADFSNNSITFYSFKESLEKIPPSNISSIFWEEVEDEAMSFKQFSFLSNKISTIDIKSSISHPRVLLFFHRFIVSLDTLVCDCKLYSFYNIMHSKEKIATPWNVHEFNQKILKCDNLIIYITNCCMT